MTKTIYLMLLTILASIGLPLQAQMRAATAETPTTGFTLNISIRNESAKVGSIGPVIVKEKNVTDHLINNTRPKSPCLWYRMEILRDGVQVSKTKEMMRRESPSKEEQSNATPFLSTLEPGDEDQFEVPVSNCYDMTVPGNYQITFTWERSDINDPNKLIHTKSNNITVTVLPADSKPPEAEAVAPK
jgi:hypothetical protein